MSLISCLCVSLPTRWPHLQRAIQGFDSQTLCNKELIIAVDATSLDYAAMISGYLAKHGHRDVRVITAHVRTQADGLILAMMRAMGDYITLWDDDDLYHPDRLMTQLSALHSTARSSAIGFSRPFYYFRDTGEIFVVQLDRPERKSHERFCLQTLAAHRPLFPLPFGQYGNKAKAQMVQALFRDKLPVQLLDLFGLHVIGVTHANQQGYEHHRGVAQTNAVSCETIRRNETEIRAALDAYAWDVPSLRICGRDGTLSEHSVRVYSQPDYHAVPVIDPNTIVVEEIQ